MIEIEHICKSQDGLGENPIWLDEEASLFWANHVGPSLKGPNVRTNEGPSLKRFNVTRNELTVWDMP